MDASRWRHHVTDVTPKAAWDETKWNFVGVDVGTSSARAGVFDDQGRLLGHSSCPIQTWREAGCIEQSSTDIWHALCSAVHGACKLAGVEGRRVRGIGFDATCSLVALGSDDAPVSVSLAGDARRNVVVWADKRATSQARAIEAKSPPALDFLGGAMSPEMQPPKLMWIKENLPDSWALTFRWMDLGDFLTYRATSDDTRSLCSTVCKWTYLGHAHMGQMENGKSTAMEALGWDETFWQEIGLGDLVEGGFSKIGRNVAVPGHALGLGLSFSAAKELGLLQGTPVSTSLIDAHAGGVGTLEGVPKYLPPRGRERGEGEGEGEGAERAGGNGGEGGAEMGEGEKREGRRDAGPEGGRGEGEGGVEGERDGEGSDLTERMVLVGGTSTCHMVVSKRKIFVPGVWGPYWSAMVPDFWLTEGGQSATGALLDHLINGHVAGGGVANRAAAKGESVFSELNAMICQLAAEKKLPFVSSLTQDLHVLPDFHGNRSPLADPKSKGILSGLTLDSSEESLSLLYLATIQGLAYGTRHIIERCNEYGHKINTIIACGGLAKNRRYLEEHADITGCNILIPRESEPVLLGSAILGAVASQRYSTIREAMKAMNAAGAIIKPSQNPILRKYHEAKYSVFKSLYKHQKECQLTMASALS